MKVTQDNLRLLLEIKEDLLEIERLLDLVFTPKRKLLSSYQLRGPKNKVNKLSYVVKDNSGRIIGSIRFWSVKVDSHNSSGLLLGPLTRDANVLGESLDLVAHALQGHAGCFFDLFRP